MKYVRFSEAIEKPKVRANLTPDQRRSVYEMLAVHLRSVRSVAIHHGLSDREVVMFLIEELSKRTDAAYKLGYSAGRCSGLPPGQERRVA